MQPETQRVGFLLIPAFSALGLTAGIEPLFIANWLSGAPLYRWRTLSRDGGAVTASSGMSFAVDGSASGPGAYDAVFVLASFEPKEHAGDAKIGAWLRRLARYGTELGAIETGSEILAAAGLLDGCDVAVHWDNRQGFSEVYPACRVVSRRFTAGKGRLTCAGATSVLDMMLHWIEARHGRGLVREIADHLLLERSYPRGSAEISHPLLAEAVEIMRQTVEEPLPLPAIARRLGLSPRQLQRLFRRHLQSTPLEHYRLLRLGRAHALLQQTRLPVTEIAVSAGFSSPEHFSRLYRQAFGRPPSADRRQATDAPVLRRRR